MPWFKIDDKLHSHRKAMRAGTDAMGLWAMAGSWCADQLTDGWVPEYAALRLTPNAVELAERLVAAGFWHAAERDGEAGWQYHDWAEYQPTREQVETKRAANTERMRRVRAHTERTARTVRSTPTRPVPKETTSSPRKRGDGVSDNDSDWQAFWSSYPRKVGKGAARKAWAKAIKLAEPAAIIAAAKAYAGATNGVDQQYVAHPSTWLNQERWTDEVQLPDAQAGTPKSFWDALPVHRAGGAA